jgi:flagellar motor protein MotB
VVVGIWGNGVDVAMTDSKLFASGGVTLRALQDVDVMVRLGQALAYNVAVTN